MATAIPHAPRRAIDPDFANLIEQYREQARAYRERARLNRLAAKTASRASREAFRIIREMEAARWL